MFKNEIFPHLHLLVSGGNSQILYLEKSFHDCQIIGQTLDDAAGECFDKIGRMIGLKYPAGVLLAKIAGLNNENILNFPIGMAKSDNLNMSFSGLKTHVRYLIQRNPSIIKFEESLSDEEISQLLEGGELNTKLKFVKDICISTQFVIIKQLLNKTIKAIDKYSPKSLGLSGGVSANLLLRDKMSELAINKTSQKLFLPHISLSGDNAVMIGLAGIAQNYKLKQ